jgi:hypothetical protein
MMKVHYLLLAGRNQGPLGPVEIRRATNTFLGLDSTVNVRHDPSVQTGFRIGRDESGDEFGEVVFGPDIYPGRGVVDPNSALSLDAAAAHELAHYYRWRDKTELPTTDQMMPLDEALTSMEAILRYERHLKPHDIRMLVSDAVQRINMYINQQAISVTSEM